jgi:maltooligosyltrehalose trehalohydrolase
LQNATEVQARRCGAIGIGDGDSVQWRVWAPKATRVDLVLYDGPARQIVPMVAEARGYFTVARDDVPDGQLYAYSLDGGPDRQDPCSLYQPKGVPGPSAVVRPDRFDWTDRAWTGVPREELVFYELHIGTFTPEGTLDAIIPRLPQLKELGITAIELLPVNQFPGDRNWGYDGVLPYATQDTYGGPHALARLVDAAHAHGLAVVVDAVYNHLGPESNFVHEFGHYYTDKYKTPWGWAINFDGPGSDAVRDWVIDNARMWLSEFHVDGLRLDAVHAIYDLGARHVLRAIKEVANDVAAATGKPRHIIGESDLNDPRILADFEHNGYGLDAQWADDFHHAVHALLSGERRGYYVDYGQPEQVRRAMETPFVFAWDYSPHRDRKHGAPPTPDLTGDQFVVCIQNHDQVGNRAKGDRLMALLGDPAKRRLAAALLLLAPHLPLIFMGEEYADPHPFPFFCGFCGEELIQAVREGRKREFADFVDDADEIPVPDARATFESAKLSWQWPPGTHHAGLRRLYQDLLAARRRWPALRDYVARRARLLPDAQDGPVLELIRGGIEPVAGRTLQALFNLSDRPQPIPTLAAGQVRLFSSEGGAYGGGRTDDRPELLAWECAAFGPAEWRG